MNHTKTVNWKRNLFITWIGCFFVGSSFSLVMPFLPLYIQGLGVSGGNVEHGRKVMMVRASIVMTLTMGGIAFVPNVWWLLGLRLLMGFFSGYIPNSTAMIASQAPKDKSGYALGTLATAMVSGTLIGPSLGGLLAEWFGMANVF